ncbi:uncharacterized protein PADG_08622 [Paracoccidioides brasiliensis Pb18]|uniref:4'-phosphopantetheinyl transferase domain-containing protein n=1 Tax=Paracoccidioides brasiliensis (strain Pb18) TaxID=502780 RepID=C1GMX1_PARBD|nr:uncharacterized protein PADG_08622 [Paracoccidioides brasiliensis Pb18]EEH44973.2 hypothetical protein PADG_08622 [Paracoccidioides brasiliensis Pb18]ODH45651.1 hypothetical protein GX48_08269 [Paracoccidioides brasiliensis]
MKRIPFPLPLNIGTDIVHLSRIYRLIHRKPANSGTYITTTIYLHRFIRRILCEQELNDFYAKFFPSHKSISNAVAAVPESALAGVNITEMARWLAGRFAAKEAARKAAPGGATSISWKDVMVQVENEKGGRSGKPEIVYLKDGGALGEVGKLSISHDGEYVIATVLAASLG